MIGDTTGAPTGTFQRISDVRSSNVIRQRTPDGVRTLLAIGQATVSPCRAGHRAHPRPARSPPARSPGGWRPESLRGRTDYSTVRESTWFRGTENRRLPVVPEKEPVAVVTER